MNFRLQVEPCTVAKYSKNQSPEETGDLMRNMLSMERSEEIPVTLVNVESTTCWWSIGGWPSGRDRTIDSEP